MNEIKKKLINDALEDAISKKQIAGVSVLVLDKGKESYYTEISNEKVKGVIKTPL